MNRLIIAIATGAIVLLANPVAAGQKASELSADLPDPRVLQVQQKVESLFVSGKFERAFFIYVNELAPIGDKYAQYMVGFMHENGLGTAKDGIVASAWYRLSAERDTPEFVQVRDKIMRTLTDSEKARSDSFYSRLRRQYGDLAVLLSSIKRDNDELSSSTGTRLKGSSGAPVTVIDPRSGATQIGADYYRDIERRMHERIEMLIELGGFEGLDDDPADVSIRELERLVNERLSSQQD